MEPRAAEAPGSKSALTLVHAMTPAQPSSAQAAPGAASWKALLRPAVGVWAGSRIALLLLTYASVLVGTPGLPRRSGHVVGVHSLAEMAGDWVRWDASWYLDIAGRGYFKEQAAAFFPLFPDLVRLLELARVPPAAAGLAIAAGGALCALAALAALTAHESGPGAAWTALLLLVSIPLGFYLFAPYSEGLFIALAATALLAARRRAWRLAAGAALLAGLTRPTGAAVAAALLVEAIAWWRSDRPAPPAVATAVVAVAAAPAAMLGFAIFLWGRFGDPFLLLRVQGRYWGRAPMAPWTLARKLAANASTAGALSFESLQIAMDVLAVVVVVGLLAAAIRRRMAPSLLVFSSVVLLLTLAAPATDKPDPLYSAARLLMAAVPLYATAAEILNRRPALRWTVLMSGLLLQGALASFYLGGGWVE